MKNTQRQTHIALFDNTNTTNLDGKCKRVCLIGRIKGANNAYRNVKNILRPG